MTKITDEFVISGNHIKNRIVMALMVTFSFMEIADLITASSTLVVHQ